MSAMPARIPRAYSSEYPGAQMVFHSGVNRALPIGFKFAEQTRPGQAAHNQNLKKNTSLQASRIVWEFLIRKKEGFS